MQYYELARFGLDQLELKTGPTPEPGPGQVRLRVRAAGLCGTDLHIAHDTYPTTPPMTPNALEKVPISTSNLPCRPK